MTYVFVGTPDMIKAGRPFVIADKHGVFVDGCRKYIDSGVRKVTFKSSKRAKTFKCKNGDTYFVHAWAEIVWP